MKPGIRLPVIIRSLQAVCPPGQQLHIRLWIDIQARTEIPLLDFFIGPGSNHLHLFFHANCKITGL